MTRDGGQYIKNGGESAEIGAESKNRMAGEEEDILGSRFNLAKTAVFVVRRRDDSPSGWRGAHRHHRVRGDRDQCRDRQGAGRLFRRRGRPRRGESTLQASSSESQRRVDLDRVTILTIVAFFMVGTLWRAGLPSSPSSGGPLGVAASLVWLVAGGCTGTGPDGLGGGNNI